MKYDRTIIAYHGCDADIAQRLLDGEPFRRSQNDYDWLGRGVYFWEYGADRALQFACEQQRRGRINAPAVVGALIQLGHCFDLMDTKCTRELPTAFAKLQREHEINGIAIPSNSGRSPTRLLRRRDCSVLNFYLDWLEGVGTKYDTVRCGFPEGDPAFEGSGIYQQSHIQIAVRNAASIIGVFRPST